MKTSECLPLIIGMLNADEVYEDLKKANAKDGTAKDLVDQIAERYAAQRKPKAKKED